MKNLVHLVLAALLSLHLLGCGGGGGSSEGDGTPPGEVSSLMATGGDGSVTLIWTNPADGDLFGVRIMRKIGSAPTNAQDGDFIFQGNVETYVDGTAVAGTSYFYTLFTYDEVPNFSAGSSTWVRVPIVERLSVATGGTEGNGSSGDDAVPGVAMSQDGRYVVFASLASNLVSGDTNSAADVFRHDRQTGTTIRVSLADDESQGNQAVAEYPHVDSSGRYIIFSSSATNLVPGDTNATTDVFVRDVDGGTTIRASVGDDESQADSYSYSRRVSGDGNLALFASPASNLVVGDSNGASDIFIRNIVGGTTTRMTVDTLGGDPNSISQLPNISRNGSYVVFVSSASDLVAGDTNGVMDIFWHSIAGGTTERVSIGDDESQGNGAAVATIPAVSNDGRYVLFVSSASNLVANDTNGAADVFLRDRTGGTTTLISRSTAGVQANATSNYATMDDDATYIFFVSSATNLVDGDNNGRSDLFVHERASGKTERLSTAADGTEGNGSVLYPPATTSDGSFVAFVSRASNLVSGDTNAAGDVFLVTNSLFGSP